MVYLITFTCYGCHMHGDESGSVDKRHNIPGTRLLEGNPIRGKIERSHMDQPPYRMNKNRRDAVLRALIERCANQKWKLLAAHVRTNHVHLVVEAEVRPERIMNDLKSYASRYLNQLNIDEPDRKRWARHGSTRWLWKEESINSAIRYVIEEQGEPMAVFSEC